MAKSIQAGEVIIPARVDLDEAARGLQVTLPQLAQKGGAKAGQEFAGKMGKELLAELTKAFTAKQLLAKESLARKLISPAEFRRAMNEAKKEFNAILLPELKRMRAAGQENTEEYKKLARSLKSVAQEGRGLARSGFSQWMDRAVRSTKLWITALATGTVYAMRRALSGLTDEWERFDQALNESLAIMGDVSPLMRREMVDTARRLSRQLNMDAETLAKAYYYLASAGLDAERSIAALPVVARFARAGHFDLERATDMLANAQSALGLSSEDAGEHLANLTRVSDVLSRAEILATANLEQFASALTNRAGAALRMLNKDVEEGVAVLAAMADQGTKGEEAGTRLDIVLRDLQTRALETSEAFERHRIAVFDDAGQMRNMADIIGDLERAMEGMSDAAQRATIMELGFSDRSVSSLLTLLGTSQKIREYEADLRQAAGTTAEVAARQMRSFEERMGRISQQWADFKRWTAEWIALPLAERLGAVTSALVDMRSPLERTVDLMEQAGVATELLMPMLVLERIEKGRELVKDLEKDIAGMRRRLAGGPRGGGEFETMGVADPAQMRLRALLAPIPEDATTAQLRGRLAELERARDEYLTQAQQREAGLVQRQILAIEELLAAEEALAQATEDVKTAEEGLAEAREKASARRELDSIKARLEELKEAAPAMDAIRKRLEARAAELEKILHPKKDEKKEPPGPPGPTPEELEAARKFFEERIRLLEARERYAERTMGIAALPEDVAAKLREIVALEREIAEAEKHSAILGGAEREAALRYVDSLKAKVAELSREVSAAIDVPKLATGFRGLTGLGLDEGWMSAWGERIASVQGEMARLDTLTRRVADAEHVLHLAELARDPRAQAEAEKKLAAARKELVAFTAALAKMLAAAGLPAKEVAAIIERIDKALRDAGISAKGADEGFAGWAGKARAIEDLARGVLSVANATDMLDEKTRRALQGVVDLASGLRAIADASKLTGWAKALGILGGAGAVVGGLTAIAGAFSGNDEAAERRHQELMRAQYEHLEQLRRNTRALQDFVEGAFSDTTEQRRREIVEGLGGLWAWGSFSLFGTRSHLGMENIRKWSGMQGLDFQQVLTWLEELQEITGAEFFDSQRGITDWESFLRALYELGTKDLSIFPETLEGQLDALDWVLSTLGDSAGSAAERLERFLSVVEGVPAAAAFAAEYRRLMETQGADAVLAWLHGLAERLAAADASLYAAGGLFPDLTPEQVQRLIEEGIGYLGEGGGLVGGGKAETRLGVSITEVQASQLLAHAATQTHYQSYLPLIHAALTGGAISPRDVALPVAAGGAVSIAIDTIEVDVQLAAAAGTPRESLVEAGRAAGAALGDELGARLRSAYRGRGAQTIARVQIDAGGVA